MRSSARTLFQQVDKQPNPNPLNTSHIPENPAMLSGDNLVTRINSIYENTYFQRELNAERLLQSLYSIGAELINSGKAYSANVEVPTSATNKNGVQPSDILMSRYRALPPDYTLVNGGHTAPNPFHALFVIRIALDHLQPESIYLIYIALKINSSNKTLQPNLITFPNDSGFLGDHAALQILRGFILNHRDYFKFLSEDEKKATLVNVDVISASYMCIANHGEYEQVNNILAGSVLSPITQVSNQLKI